MALRAGGIKARKLSPLYLTATKRLPAALNEGRMDCSGKGPMDRRRKAAIVGEACIERAVQLAIQLSTLVGEHTFALPVLLWACWVKDSRVSDLHHHFHLFHIYPDP